MSEYSEDRGFLAALVDDGRPLIAVTALALVISGCFALFLASVGQFLPHDVRYLGMTAEQLCAYDDCRVVRFMFHDRVAFGGSLIAIGVLYLWLNEFPLRRGEPWAWWALVVSGGVGFASFLTYLGYGYLDSWHGVGTLLLLPVFALGLAFSFRRLRGSRGIRSLLQSGPAPNSTAARLGRSLLLATASGMLLAGLTIMALGMSVVFVPEDLTFMGARAADLHAINPRLVALIAHDRSGFGGGICSFGMTMLFGVWCATPSRSFWQALLTAGAIGFGSAIGVHVAVGYLAPTHVAPAMAGAVLFAIGLALVHREMTGFGREKAAPARRTGATALTRK